MAKYNFDKYIERKGTHSAKWECMDMISPHANEETLPLWVADMDFSCPPEVLEALHSRIDDQIFGYSMADDSYYQSVQGWLNRRFDWEVAKDDIFITNGILPALENLISIFSEQGDGVIIQPPVYHKFADIINLKQRKVVNNPLLETDGVYSVDFDDLAEKASDPANKIMLLCSPHNPVGNVWTEEELKKTGQICLDNDVLLISDEIHFDLLRKWVTHIPVATLFPESDKIITCTAPSKTFNMAGLHISNIIIQNEEYKKKWRTQVGFGLPSPLGLAAVTAAYNLSEEWLEELKSYIDENFIFARDYLTAYMPKARFVVPEGTYFIWLDLSEYGYSSQELDDLIIKEANVLLEGGTMFGEEGEGYQRINIACPRPILEEALRRISGAL